MRERARERESLRTIPKILTLVLFLGAYLSLISITGAFAFWVSAGQLFQGLLAKVRPYFIVYWRNDQEPQ